MLEDSVLKIQEKQTANVSLEELYEVSLRFRTTCTTACLDGRKLVPEQLREQTVRRHPADR